MIFKGIRSCKQQQNKKSCSECSTIKRRKWAGVCLKNVNEALC